MNLCFVCKNLYILKLIDIYFFTYVVFENMKINKLKFVVIYKNVIIIIDISFLLFIWVFWRKLKEKEIKWKAQLEIYQ